MKSDVFKTELNYIQNNRLKESVISLIELLPDYFFEIPASSTGKYHPKYALGDGGLVRHTKVAVRIAYEILYLDSSLAESYTDDEKDLVLISLLIHDGLKEGLVKEKYTRFDHPILIKEFVNDNKDKTKFTDEEVKLIGNMVASHMGPWNTSEYSNVVLPLPKTKYEKLVHLCDLLASRKYLEVPFSNNEIDYN